MAVQAPIFKNERTTFERLEKFVSKEYFTDCNLKGKLYAEECVIEQILHIDCGQNRISVGEAITRLNEEGQQIKIGLSMGPTWSTHWFKLVFKVPQDWKNKTVHLVWDTGSEAMVWSKDACPMQGLSGDANRLDYNLPDKSITELYVEVACNSMFGAGNNGFINAPDPDKTFTLKTAKLVVYREEVFQLLMDFDVLIGLSKHLPQDDPKRYEYLYFANNLVNEFIGLPGGVDNSKQLQTMHNCVTQFLTQHQMSKPFEIHAVGNCHIDTAWLWPYDETKRKCARSWSTSIALMEQYPGLIKFACSQAQQLDWIKELYPSLFKKILEQAKQNSFIPVGGCWVEMDGNLPGGESFVRQILYGQKFFHKNFGVYCTEFWLPDTFGYSAQLPQLIKLGEMKRFVTQKLSWNLVNKFPHHTFYWKGIDGTNVLTHFPPGDTYCMQVTVEDCLKTVNNFRDKGRSNVALMLYGHGDGGGGPDREMLERLKRLSNAPGCPKMVPSTPATFFESVENSDLANLCTWDGELYLELHNGTYTSHATLKRMNRVCEFLLKDCEFLSVINYLISRGKVCKSFEIEWKDVLLNQFHDVLPGTSIGMVIKDALELYGKVVESCENYLASGMNSEANRKPLYLSTLQHAREVDVDDEGCRRLVASPMAVSDMFTNEDQTGAADVESTGEDSGDLQVYPYEDSYVLENVFLRAVFNSCGQMISLQLKRRVSDEDFLRHFDFVPKNQFGNTFVIFDDVPLYWDAWDVMDYHLETRKEMTNLIEPLKIKFKGPNKVSMEFRLSIGSNSFLTQEIILRPCQTYLEFHTKVDWAESHKFLKVEFPVDVRSAKVSYEIQFGHVERPTHRNTSWDSAKFEVCAQKWADLSEFDRGLALINNGKHGYSCYDNVLTLSLLRSPKAPDKYADMNCQSFSYAVMPHAGPFQRNCGLAKNVIDCAYEFNSIVRKVYPLNDSIKNQTIFCLDSPSIIIESVKISECKKGVVIRLYESFGSKCAAVFSSHFKLKDVHVCNLLEEIKGKILLSGDSESNKCVRLFFKPFQIVSLFLTFDFTD